MMRKRNVELQEYLRDMEIQLALTKLQYPNRARKRMQPLRSRRPEAKRTDDSSRRRQARNE